MVSHVELKKADFIETENRIVVARAGRRGKRDDIGERVHIFSYKKF